jgi:hypothetical protein
LESLQHLVELLRSQLSILLLLAVQVQAVIVVGVVVELVDSAQMSQANLLVAVLLLRQLYKLQ